MTNSLIEPFVRDGFVKLAGAVPSPVVDACVDLLWEATGLDRRDPSTWTEPVQWVGGMAQPPFVQAMNTLVLLQACDELAGPGEEVYATGRAGDIYVCHPFLVHAAQANHGRRPRFLGQPAIPANFPYRFDRPRSELSPVELTIRQGLDRIAGAEPG